MAYNFDVYKEKVVDHYEQKKAAGMLSDRLLYPTRARIRNECLHLVETSLQREDERMLRSYLRMASDNNDFRAAVRRTSADDFQAMHLFVGKPSINTDEKNIELLAWLTGYQPRPYHRFNSEYVDHLQEHAQLTNETLQIGKQESDERISDTENTNFTLTSEIPKQEKEQVNEPNPPKPLIVFPYKIVAGITLAIVAGLTYLLIIPHCMYWNGDSYVKSSCYIKRPDTALYPIDEQKFKHFRRVHQLDTLTQHSIGKLWYLLTHNGCIKIFTTDGRDPKYPDIPLKKLHDYQLIKIHNGNYSDCP